MFVVGVLLNSIRNYPHDISQTSLHVAIYPNDLIITKFWIYHYFSLAEPWHSFLLQYGVKPLWVLSHFGRREVCVQVEDDCV